LTSPVNLGALSIGAARSVARIAKHAAQSLSFADTLAAGEPAQADPKSGDRGIPAVREKLAGAIEAVLAQLGIATDPALTFGADDTGTISLDGNHPRAAEINTAVNQDDVVNGLAMRIAGGTLADRTLVIHHVA